MWNCHGSLAWTLPLIFFFLNSKVFLFYFMAGNLPQPFSDCFCIFYTANCKRSIWMHVRYCLLQFLKFVEVVTTLLAFSTLLPNFYPVYFSTGDIVSFFFVEGALKNLVKLSAFQLLILSSLYGSSIISDLASLY